MGLPVEYHDWGLFPGHGADLSPKPLTDAR